MSNREETNLLKLKEEGVIAHMRNAAFDGCTCGVCEAVRELISDALQSAAVEIARKFSVEIGAEDWDDDWLTKFTDVALAIICKYVALAIIRKYMDAPPSPSAEQELIAKLVEALEMVSDEAREWMRRHDEDYALKRQTERVLRDTDALLSKVAAYRKGKPSPDSREEGICDDCHREYTTPWFAANDVWNKVVDGPAMLCVSCFMLRAEKAGLVTTGWQLVPEVFT